MKVFLFLIVALFGLAIAVPVPEEWDDVDERDEDEPIGEPEPLFPWYRGPDFPSYGIEDDDDGNLQFWGVGDNIFDSYNRLRSLMEIIQRRLYGSQNATDSFFDSLPPNYENTTFTSQVVNGSIITVNSTIQKHQGNNTGFIFVHKVVNIRPQNETIGNPETVAPIITETPEAVTGTPEFGTGLQSTENPASTQNPNINNIP